MTLLLHVLMLFLLSGGTARDVEDFEKECRGFFANGESPTRFSGPPQYEQICQTLNGVVYYATYYDTINRILVYSAYKFEGIMGCKRKKNWFIEPQGSVDIKLCGEHQALNGDYEKSGFDKGHLAPVYQAQSQSCSDATFTLTNAAPQNPSFNSGQWRVLEENIAKALSEQYLPKKYSVYIVSGVTPGTSKLKNRVNVPSYFWTAYCCLDQNNRCQISRGFIGENKNITPQNTTVNDLKKELANLYKVTSFEVFDSSTVPPMKQKSKAFRINVTCSQFWFSFLCVLFLFYLPKQPCRQSSAMPLIRAGHPQGHAPVHNVGDEILIIHHLILFIMTLLLHVLMLFLLSGGSAEVVKDFEQKCGQFFAGGKSPTTFTGKPQYRQICQTLNGVVYYATYYDTINKIPVYSAYKFAGIMGCKRQNNWYIEPQLDENNAPSDMKLEKDVTIQGLGVRQALNSYYEGFGKDYHKGHLAPVYQAQSQSCASATFTLTNAAPQNSSFNSGQWRVLEENIAKYLSKQCLEKRYSVFIVTGVVPGPKNTQNDKMNMPSHFWTAFCCLDQNNICKISRGYIGENYNITPEEKTVNVLEAKLAELYNKVNPVVNTPPPEFKIFWLPCPA
ncbi:Endonuclease domain-containing 1 protein [Anabarilius grahami]|uniref:Endonuclease domain-containing 1 protein n=1 Tax=Anabarilius grahami TaxID=495550 RepID=A0A3N0XMM6_ANAGA|nr:Endonuclease domain-containing 1 protein [Anabarilius grahami]